MSDGEKQGLKLQPRDYELLAGLFESRVMTHAHISALYFAGKKEMAKKRLQKLKAAGFVRERRKHLTEPSALFLTTKAFKKIRDEGHIEKYPRIGIDAFEKRSQVSDLTLQHELAVMDVKIAMVTSINATDRFTVAEFATWPMLHRFRACTSRGISVTVRPDGFVRVHEKEDDGGASEHAFFLEVDRSTETLDVLCERCHCYLDFYRSGGFAARCGLSREEYKRRPFRVLIVCKSAERRDNIARRLLRNNPPVGTQVWLTIIEQMTCMIRERIWVIPALYQSGAFPDGSSKEKGIKAFCDNKPGAHNEKLGSKGLFGQ